MISAFAPDHSGAHVRPSPNFGERRGMDGPDILLLHYTGMVSGQAAEDRLCDPASEVSAHYLVHEDGTVVQMVPEALRAWHAGAGSWHGEGDINSRSVGIEIVNPGHGLGYRDFPAVQIDAVIALCADIAARHRIRPERVLAHSDVAPGRKVDPGEKFPWGRLARAGLACVVEPDDDTTPALGPGDAGAAVAQLQQDLSVSGYGIDTTGFFDARTAAVIDAFQRRHRPSHVSGAADRGTLATLKRLLACIRGGNTV